jgi:UDP-N-acetylmuramoylalanine--D-glutamate ligase
VITSSFWRGKRYAVLGLARSGAATVHALLASGAEVVAWDNDEAAREAVLLRKQEPSGHELQPASPGLLPSQEHITLADPLTLDLTGFAAVVVSPGVPLNRHPIAGHAARYGVPVIGDIELFAQARAELPPHKVVGITGTNGKSTTTALVHHILQTAGVPTTMGGNIGLPILGQEPLPAGGVYVLELSSYQIDLTFTLDCDVAVLLNITPDHLDRYASFEAYRDAKLRLLAMQSSTSKAINLLVEPAPSAVARQKMAAHQKTWPALQGPHNAENAIAATAACSALGIDGDAMRSGLSSYPGLPHRMERIRELNGVQFVNDSKATNADSAAPALAAYPAIRWILGGQAKTAELDACVPHFGHVRSAYTIGEAGGMFAELLRPHMAVEESGTLAVAVAHAARDAVAGETVLLSPACASFDQFRNFEDRGDAFRQLVEAL